MAKTQNKKVTILGGSGFVGSNLAKRLEQAQFAVTSLSSKDLDLTGESSVETIGALDCDVLVFASAITPDRGKDGNAFMKNVLMGKHVADGLRNSSPKQVIYISSDAVYHDDVAMVDETSRTDSTGLYGMSHAVREKLLEEVCKTKNIPLLCLRPCAIYGQNDTHGSYGPNRFLKTAIADKKIALFGGGEETRDHILIDDLCRLILLCIEQETTGVLNAATGKALSFMAVAEAVKAAFKDQVEIATSPRQSPVTHKHFNITKLISLFPDFQFTNLQNAIQNLAKRAATGGGSNG